MEKTRKLTVIGILDIASAVIAFLFAGYLLYTGLFRYPVRMAGPITTVVSAGVLFIALGIFALIGGVSALRRTNRKLVIAGSFSASICFPFLGIPAGIIALTSQGIPKKERIPLFAVFIPVWIIRLGWFITIGF
ncbi:MAG: hypothetical protein HY663_02550 [Chloroflexi bacterium]|nr:hypothetical protein [Chloroflexota bacterium]